MSSQIEKIRLLDVFLTMEQRISIDVQFKAYYEKKLKQAEAVKRKQADPATRNLKPSMDDEINVLETAASCHYSAISAILRQSTLPDMLKPTGLKKVDGMPAGYTTLAERLTLALCQVMTEQAKLDAKQTSLDEPSEWRDEYVSSFVEEALADLSEAVSGVQGRSISHTGAM